MDFALSPDQARFVSDVSDFARARVAPRAAEIDRTGAYPRDLLAEAAALGLLGITVPRELGGAGQNYVAYAAAIEALAAASATLAVIVSVHNSLVVEPVREFGSPEQQDRWVRPLASGAAFGAFALSEAEAGSDAANQQTVATEDEDGYRLRGEKVWVTNAEAAALAIVFAATQPGEGGRGISAFLVPLPSPGLDVEPSPDSLGVRGLGCRTLRLRDVRVSSRDLLGERDAGFRLAKRALEGGRVAIAAQALGVGRAALREALEYSRRRKAFGHPISVFQAIQFQLADLATDLEAARMLTWRAADTHDRSPHAATEAAMAKLHASEAAHRAADRAMQILASEGYRRGSTIERLFRDIRAAEIYQGTSEVQRLLIARSIVERPG
jgi:alkylation response protein AidB-like acyl-CoA dehydrogenase